MGTTGAGVPDLKVTFSLNDRDLRHLRNILRKAGAVAGEHSEAEIVQATEEMAESVRAARPPNYILERLAKLEGLIGLLKDTGWPMPARVRQKAMTALVYFTDPHDLIPDQIPGLGFLDDAIMIELIVRELRHEIEGYEEFRRYRHAEWDRPWYQQTPEKRDKKLAARRTRIRARIKQKDEREAQRAGRSSRRFGIF
jgi:uncharacterized membrane protein YkvA (DUF1232 family)